MTCRLAAAGILAFFSTFSAAMAGECSATGDVLGTSRVIEVNPAEYKRLGTIQYPRSLPLQDHEVVLTFDDGPLPPHTDRVLDALAAECVKATFFVVGEMAVAHPAALQRAYREGHTIGTHTDHHARLDRVPAERAKREISDGLASAAKVLGDKSAVAPFFRFPYLDLTGAAEDYAVQLGLSIWSADLHASDWNFITPERETALALDRLESKKKGVLLLHDIHDRTAKALPVLLRELKKRGFRVVHVVPASGAFAKIEDKPEPKTAEKPEQKTAEKSEQAAANPEQKTQEKPEQAAVANAEQAPAAQPEHRTPVHLARRSLKNPDHGGWDTRIKRSRSNNKVTAMSKRTPLQSLIDGLWH